MEMQFDKSTCKNLHKILSHVLEQELTQEIRLPESLPDIGRVVGCWGQIVLRSKEWYNSSASVTGGIMAWVIYAPEDGSDAKSVETWIPFQIKWDIPETQRDGYLSVMPLVKTIDARLVSPRKIMFRTNVSVQGDAYEPRETEVYHSNQVPEDVQVLKQTYPLDIPVEAGEKLFQIEEQLQLPEDMDGSETICYYDLKPQVTEFRILGDKLLFRGNANLHVVFLGKDRWFSTLDQELSFSQYTHLDNEYGANASVWQCPIVTGVEMDFASGQPMVKASLSVQYIIYDREAVEITEDAYSITRDIIPEKRILRLFSKLDILEKNMELSQKIPLQAKQVLDVVAYPSHPEKMQNGEMLQIQQPVTVQVLYVDFDGNIQGTVATTKEVWEFISDSQNSADIKVVCSEKPQFMHNGEDVTVVSPVQLQAMVSNENLLPMTTSIEINGEKDLDPARPSLIVRKVDNCRIWDIAKQYGAKVADIKVANVCDNNPNENQVLLIPIN